MVQERGRVDQILALSSSPTAFRWKRLPPRPLFRARRWCYCFGRAATPEGLMGAVEHLKTLCCLGLKPESSMIAVAPLLHEIIPHGCSRLGLLAHDATMTSVYAENPATGAIFRERLWRFMDDPSALASLWHPLFRAWASVGLCTGRAAPIWKVAITGK